MTYKGYLILLVLPCIALLTLPNDCAAQQSDSVIVYNGGGTGYDAAAEGYAWQQAGFTNADGSPMNMDANGNIVDGGGKIIGNKIVVGGHPIGWRNAATNTSIVDINRGTMADAYGQTANNGTINVVKHGQYIDRPDPATGKPNGRPDAGDILGGAVQLDDGRFFTGFGTGTGVSTSTPYNLPARPGANITLQLTCCWSANDPDGPGGPQTSVATSATSVNGISHSIGSTGPSQTGASVEYTNPLPPSVTQKDVDDAVDAAFAAARPGGFTNYTDWVDSLPFLTQLSRLRQQLPSVLVKGNVINLSWTIKYQTGIGPTGANKDLPQTLDTSASGLIIHETPSGTGLIGAVNIESITDLDLIPGWETFHLGRLGDLPGPPPDGLGLATGIYSLSPMDGLVEAISGMFILDYLPVADVGTLGLYSFNGGTWSPLITNPFVDPSSGQVSAGFSATDLDLAHPFIVAGFSVPEPSSIMLVLVGIGGLGGIRAWRKAIRKSGSSIIQTGLSNTFG
jgi:hypothetical protein